MRNTVRLLDRSDMIESNEIVLVKQELPSANRASRTLVELITAFSVSIASSTCSPWGRAFCAFFGERTFLLDKEGLLIANFFKSFT